MDEAEKLCDRVAIVDHGHIIAQGPPQDLIESIGSTIPAPPPRATSTTLEDVFVALTGRTLRDE
jgi:ABC-2 type transport system ATP-binding protein